MVALTKKIVEEILIGVLKEVQALGGYLWVALEGDVPLIGTLEGFDSLTGLEATVLVEQRLAAALGLGSGLHLRVTSVFVSTDGRRALTVGQIVGNLCREIGVEA